MPFIRRSSCHSRGVSIGVVDNDDNGVLILETIFEDIWQRNTNKTSTLGVNYKIVYYQISSQPLWRLLYIVDATKNRLPPATMSRNR